MLTKKNVLITGAGGGFGKLTVTALINAGHSVVASLRDVSGRNRQAAIELKQLGAKIVEIDVTIDESVEAGVADAISQIGSIDVLINNAGLGALGIQEAYTPDDWKKIFEINVFGVQRMTRAVLPHMKKQGNGLLILISSLTARLSIPFQGPYGPSKWAAEALAESYRIEVAQFGIESCIVEPGGFPTTFIYGLAQPEDKARLEDYGEVGKMPGGFLNMFEDVFAANPAQNPSKVAEAISELINMPHGERPIRTIVDYMLMGPLVKPLNELLEKSNNEVYNSFQIRQLTTVKK